MGAVHRQPEKITGANNTYPKGGISDCIWINCIYFIVLHLITIAATVPPFG